MVFKIKYTLDLNIIFIFYFIIISFLFFLFGSVPNKPRPCTGP